MLTELLRRYEDLVEHRGSIDSRRSELVREIDASVDIDDAEVAEFRDRARAVAGDIDTLTADDDQLQLEVREAETAMQAAFRTADSLQKARNQAACRPDPADDAMRKSGSPLLKGSSARDVKRWWDALSDGERTSVISAYPDVIGSADGVPVAHRDRANRLLLDLDLEALTLLDQRGELPRRAQRTLENARAARAAVDQGAALTDPVTGEHLHPMVFLYDPRAFGGDGRVAISLGDPDTADNVSVLVPGFGTAGGSASGQIDRADSIYQTVRFEAPNHSVASMMWIGYDAPSGSDAAGVTGEGRARDGGALLANSIDGLRASREGSGAHLTVVGHSYGSTTTGHAASDHGLHVDDLVVVGSPGLGDEVDHAADLGIGADHVWVGKNSSDPVAMLGDTGTVNGGVVGLGPGNDPAEDRFGAYRFRAESLTRGSVLPDMADHSKYFDPTSEAARNIGLVISGHYNDVSGAAHVHDPWLGKAQDPEGHRHPEPLPPLSSGR